MISYAETRAWAVWLQIFTSRDLADSMGVDEEVIESYLIGLEFNGTIEDTGDRINGRGPPEVIYRHVPLPPGPKVHEIGPLPEVLAVMQMGGWEILSPRGLPVRLIDNTKRRDMMQGTGGARLRVKMRDTMYQKMQQAKLDRAEKDRQKRIAAQQGIKRRLPNKGW